MTLAIKSLGLIEVICDNPYIKDAKQLSKIENILAHKGFGDREIIMIK